MNYLPITVLAFFLNGISIIISKLLLDKNLPHPISYVFYISAYSLLILLGLPWIHSFSSDTLILASLSTLLWTTGLYFLFRALKIGLVDRVAPIIGTLTPLFLIIYYFLIEHSISLNQTWGALLATSGLFFLILPFLRNQSKLSKKDKRKEIIFEFLAGVFFAASYISLKAVYAQTDFLTGLVVSRFVVIPLLALILIIPSLKRLVFTSKKDEIEIFSKTGAMFLGSQVSGGASQLLIYFAVSLANPALVNSLQGVQYVFLFAASVFLARSHPSLGGIPKNGLKLKVLGIALIFSGLYILSVTNTKPNNSTLGVTYSPRYAKSLGLDPKLTFVSILDDLSPQTLRLPIYWDEIAPTPYSFDFSYVDYYVKVLEQRGIKLTLVVGFKVPRYPECYSPSWAKNLNKQSFNQALETELMAIVNRYKSSKVLSVWQVENEPLFPFGVCPEADLDRLKEEIATVRKIDPFHPVMVTESGEFGLWITSSQISEITGTTLYRRTLAPYLTWFKSPLPPFFYQLKAMFIHLFYPGKKIYVSELQAEPWANVLLPQTTYDYQTSAFPLSDLRQNVEFTKEAGFDTIYLWGVEWWYYLKSLGHPEYVNQAILIFKDVH